MRSAASTPQLRNKSGTNSGTSTKSHTSSATDSSNVDDHTSDRGHTLLVKSSVCTIQAFLFFWHHHPATLVCHILGQQAFNAATTLAIDAWESYNEEHESLINEACTIFYELRNTGVHKLAEMAFSHISAGLAQLRHRRQERETAGVSRSSPALALDLILPEKLFGDTAGSHSYYEPIADP